MQPTRKPKFALAPLSIKSSRSSEDSEDSDSSAGSPRPLSRRPTLSIQSTHSPHSPHSPHSDGSSSSSFSWSHDIPVSSHMSHARKLTICDNNKIPHFTLTDKSPITHNIDNVAFTITYEKFMKAVDGQTNAREKSNGANGFVIDPTSAKTNKSKFKFKAVRLDGDTIKDNNVSDTFFEAMVALQKLNESDVNAGRFVYFAAPIVKTIQCVSYNGERYLCYLMPNIDGNTIDKERFWINMDGIRRNRVKRQLKDAFKKLSDNKIFHNDIRQQNVIVTEQGTVHIIDWDGATLGVSGTDSGVCPPISTNDCALVLLKDPATLKDPPGHNNKSKQRRGGGVSRMSRMSHMLRMRVFVPLSFIIKTHKGSR